MTASLGDKFMLTARFDEAFRYAHRLHQSRLRKGTAIPYISHLMAVSAIIIAQRRDEGDGFPVPMRDFLDGPLTQRCSPVEAGDRRRDAWVSRPEEFHPRPLAERCVNLSIHTAPIR